MGKYDEMDKYDREDEEVINLFKNQDNGEFLEGIPFHRFDENGYIEDVIGREEIKKFIGVDKPKDEPKKVEPTPQHLQESKSSNNIYPTNLKINVQAQAWKKENKIDLKRVLPPWLVTGILILGIAFAFKVNNKINEKIEASRQEQPQTVITEVVEELDPDYLSKYFVIVNSTDPSTDVLSDQITNDLAQMGVEVRGLHSDNELINTLVNEESMCHFKRTTVITLDARNGNSNRVIVGVDEKTSTSDVLALNCVDAIKESPDLTAGVRIGKASITPHSNDPLMSESETKRLAKCSGAYLTCIVTGNIYSDAEMSSQLADAIVTGFGNYARTSDKLQKKDCIHEVKGIGDVKVEDLAKIYYGSSASDKVNLLYELNELKGDTVPVGATIITDKAPEPLAITNTNDNNIGYY